jgi:ABC-2 type transport system permease protein
VKLLFLQLRMSLVFSLQYRSDFVVDGLVEVLWAATALVPLRVVVASGRTVGGWTYDEALVVMGWFTIMKALLDGAIAPSIAAVVEQVRKGTLDFVLLKPKDAQFLVSTARFYPWRSINVLTGFGIVVYALGRLGRVPTPLELATAAVLLGTGVAILYAMLVLTVSIAFYAVRVDNLTFLLGAMFDAARWPGGAFRGVVRVAFTYVLPLIVVTTYPSEALLGRLSVARLVGAMAGAGLFLVVGRLSWRRALGAYTSAGG